MQPRRHRPGATEEGVGNLFAWLLAPVPAEEHADGGHAEGVADAHLLSDGAQGDI